MQVEVIRTYTARQPDELSLQMADVVLVWQTVEDGMSAPSASLIPVLYLRIASLMLFNILLIFHLPVSTVSFHHSLLHTLHLSFKVCIYFFHIMDLIPV